MSSVSDADSALDAGEVEAETRRTGSGRESSFGEGRGELGGKGESARFGGARLTGARGGEGDSV